MRCLCAVISFVALAWGSPALQAQESLANGAADTIVVPGTRVGAITAYSSLAVLRALYGWGNIIPKMQPLPSGDTAPGARLFAGTDRQIDIVWDEDAREKRVAEVRIVGKAWSLENGLKTGLSLAEAEKIIGKPVKGTSSDGDGGVIASIEMGLPGQILGLGFTSLPTTEPKRAAGNNKKSPAVQPETHNGSTAVTKIVIWFRQQ